MNSGGASSHAPPSLAVAWVHAPPHKTWKPGGSGSVSSPLPFSAGGDNAVTCKTPKTQQASLFLSLDLFLPLSDLLLSFFRWQIRCEGEATVLGRGGVQALLGGRRRTDLGSVGAAVPGLFVDPEREAVGSVERGEEPGG
jgi:hypothetical protein